MASTGKKADHRKEDRNDLVINYLTLRRALGWMGIALPFALIAGSFAWNGGHIETSISNYFYTSLRDVFVVTLCAVALFLFTYRGYDQKDRRVTNIAGAFGLITAFVSTNFKCDIVLPACQLTNDAICPAALPGSDAYHIIPVPHAEYIGYIHLGCAAVFFLSLAYMSYFQFTKTDEPKTQQKRKRNAVYKACGLIILICILLLFPCFIVPQLKEFYDAHKLIFWAESVSLWAFGISWLIKGEFILKD